MTSDELLRLLKGISKLDESARDTPVLKLVGKALVTLISYRVIEEQPQDKGQPTQISRPKLTKLFTGGEFKRQSIRDIEKIFFDGTKTVLLPRGGSEWCRIDQDITVKKRMAQLESWILNSCRMFDVQLLPFLKVGIGISLAGYHGWIAARHFRRERKQEESPPIAVNFVTGLPQDLRKLGEQKQLDFVVTSFTDEEIHDRTNLVGEPVRLPVKLMADRRHEFPGGIPAEDSERWKLLESKRLVIQRDRWPPVGLDRSLLPESCDLVYASSWPEAFATVLASEDVFCLGCPAVLPARERTRFREIEIKALGHLLVAVKKYGRTDPWAPTDEEVNRLALSFRSYLGDMSNESKRACGLLEDECIRTAQLTLAPNGEKTWLRGVIKNLNVTATGRLRGDHFLKPKWGDEMQLTFDGTLTYDQGKGVHYVNWRAWKRGDSGPEAYTASFAASPNEMKTLLIGIWSGRATWSDTVNLGLGPIILFPNEKQYEDVDFTGFTRGWLHENELHNRLMPPEAQDSNQPEFTEELNER